MLHNPTDPFLTDALGAAKFARETIKLSRRKSVDLDAAVYWSARQAFHWVQCSKAWHDHERLEYLVLAGMPLLPPLSVRILE